MTEPTTTEPTTTEPTPTVPPKMVWPTLVYRDAHAAIEFLTNVFGFEQTLVVPGPAADVIDHAELLFPEGGGVMLGSAQRSGSVLGQLPPGSASAYVVTDRVDELWERALAAGCPVVRELHDTDYGSRDFVVRDPEGNIWSFGTYPGAPRPA